MQTLSLNSDPMTTTRHWLDQLNIPYRQTSEYQLKIGHINYYPSRGSIILDGQKTKHPGTGLDALAILLAELGYLPAQPYNHI
jgi:hypothetical protein